MLVDWLPLLKGRALVFISGSPAPGCRVCVCVCYVCLVIQSRLTLLRPHGLSCTRLLCPWDFPGKNTGVGCHFLLHGIFLTQGSNPGLLHCRWILYCLSHQGSPWQGVRLDKYLLNESIDEWLFDRLKSGQQRPQGQRRWLEPRLKAGWALDFSSDKLFPVK